MAAIMLQKLLPEQAGRSTISEVKGQVRAIHLPKIERARPVKTIMPPEEHGYIKPNKYEFY